MHPKRHFTTADSDPFLGLDQHGNWSVLAVQLAANQYLRRDHESTVRQLIERVVAGIVQAGLKQGLLTSDSSVIFSDELICLLSDQKGAFNSPVWFNVGLHEAYGVVGKAENFAYDFNSNSVQPVSDAYQRPQASACFIQSVQDDLLSLFDLLRNEAKLFRYGSGTGSNFSVLRAKQEKISSGGTSSGLISFLEVFDRAAAATKSGGTTRRAAKMVTLDADHPEIEDFIDWKIEEEKKVAALVAAGYSSEYTGKAYRTVAAQNANHSISLTDEFLRAMQNREEWSLRARTTGQVIKSVSAESLWKKMVHAAWSCADPGIQFNSHINSWHTCPNSAPIHASNPCSEYLFIDDSACNLASINLVKFWDPKSGFDVSGFQQACRILILAQEILVDYASYPTRKIAENAHRFRTLGLGFTNLGSLLMRMGLGYDSDEARAIASGISALMTGEAYSVSTDLAEERGPFDGFLLNREPMLKVIQRHGHEVRQISTQTEAEAEVFLAPIRAAALKAWGRVEDRGSRFGFRHAQVTLIAPTGTIGFFMDCDTLGIEPEFAWLKNKKLANGQTVEITNQSLGPALDALGYTPEQKKQIEDVILKTGSIVGAAQLLPQHRGIFVVANPPTEDGSRLSPSGHLKMMAAVQPFISGGISKTLNLPKTATEADVEWIFHESWRLGLKAIAIYRDGSKLSQPLNTLKDAIRCGECGSQTQRIGGCFVCSVCGLSTACS